MMFPDLPKRLPEADRPVLTRVRRGLLEKDEHRGTRVRPERTTSTPILHGGSVLACTEKSVTTAETHI